MDNRYKLKEIYTSSLSCQAYATAYFQRIGELMRTVDVQVVAKIIGAFQNASKENKCIYFIANGGSAAVSAHWANDLSVGAFIEGIPSFRAFSLPRNVESVTAIGNDHAFEDIFLNQLKNNMTEGDVVVALSASGNSENIIKAMKWAAEHGAETIGISGFDGARLANMCHINLHIATTKDEYGPVEDLFAILGHLISGYLTMNRGKNLYR